MLTAVAQEQKAILAKPFYDSEKRMGAQVAFAGFWRRMRDIGSNWQRATVVP